MIKNGAEFLIGPIHAIMLIGTRTNDGAKMNPSR